MTGQLEGCFIKLCSVTISLPLDHGCMHGERKKRKKKMRRNRNLDTRFRITYKYGSTENVIFVIWHLTWLFPFLSFFSSSSFLQNHNVFSSLHPHLLSLLLSPSPWLHGTRATRRDRITGDRRKHISFLLENLHPPCVPTHILDHVHALEFHHRPLCTLVFVAWVS